MTDACAKARMRWGACVVEVDYNRRWANCVYVKVVEAGIVGHTYWARGTRWWVNESELKTIEEESCQQKRLI